MQLPLNERVDEIIEFLSYPSYYGLSNKKIKDYQNEIDRFSELNPDDETYGKLLLAQALIHYRNRKFDDAYYFADAAHNNGVRDSVLFNMLDDILNPGDEKNRYLIGISGWLAWYCVGLFIIIPWSIVNVAADIIYFSANYNEVVNEAGTAGILFGLLLLASRFIHIILLMVSLVLIIKRSRFAKKVVIGTLAFIVFYSLIEVVIFFIEFDTSDSGINQLMGNNLRNIFHSIIWALYFMFSKRVTATLIK